MTAILTKHPALGKSCFASEKAKCKMRLVLVSSGYIMALLMNAKTCGGMIIPHMCMTLSRTQFLFCYQNTELGVQCIGPILQWSKLRFICVNCGVNVWSFQRDESEVKKLADVETVKMSRLKRPEDEKQESVE